MSWSGPRGGFGQTSVDPIDRDGLEPHAPPPGPVRALEDDDDEAGGTIARHRAHASHRSERRAGGGPENVAGKWHSGKRRRESTEQGHELLGAREPLPPGRSGRRRVGPRYGQRHRFRLPHEAGLEIGEGVGGGDEAAGSRRSHGKISRGRAAFSWTGLMDISLYSAGSLAPGGAFVAAHTPRVCVVTPQALTWRERRSPLPR